MAQSLGEAVRTARENAGLTQDELAERTGVSKAYISQLENGHYTTLRANFMFKLADALKVNCEFFKPLLADDQPEEDRPKGKLK